MGEPRILVIDDEEVVLASLRKIFSRKGYVTDAFLTAREGLERLSREDYDLVVTDLMMPEMNGIELLKELHRRDLNVPTIMITGYPSISTAVKAMRLGARDYIAKPFTRKELLSPVMRALRRDVQDDSRPFARLEGGVTDPSTLVPGTVFVLPHHSWARFEQDGVFEVGVEDSFLAAAPRVARASFPEEGELLDQGSVGIRLTNEPGEEHGVAMPVSGQVMAINSEAVLDPGSIREDIWLLKVLPTHLDSEVRNLMVRAG